MPLHKQTGRQGLAAAVVLGAVATFGGSAPGAETASRTASEVSRYCTACWRNARLHPDAWSDCTQQVFCRLLERVEPEAWGKLLAEDGQERLELVRAIDAVRKRTQRGRKWYVAPVEQIADPGPARQRHLADERQAIHQAAAELLTPRQRRIIQLSLDGWTVHEIASALRLPRPRVSDEKYKAIHRLRERLIDRA